MKHELRTAALVAALLGMASMSAARAQQAAPAPHKAQAPADRVDLGVTSITGNSELPKVLYIVPWKKSGPEDAAVQPAADWLDQVLAPLDPAVFKRELDYREQLFESGRGNRVKDKK